MSPSGSVEQRIRQEVETPALIGSLWDRQRRSGAECPFASATPADLQPFLAIETSELLVVHDQPLAAHQHQQTTVAEPEAECLLCAAVSRRIHSRYVRHVADLPSAGRKVHLRLLTRRFSYETPHCRRRIFAERFGEDVVPLRRRRTARLEYIVHHLGLVLGGRQRPSSLSGSCCL